MFVFNWSNNDLESYLDLFFVTGPIMQNNMYFLVKRLPDLFYAVLLI